MRNRKTYFCFMATKKFSCKGLNRRNNELTKEKYMTVLNTSSSGGGVNKGENKRVLLRDQDGLSSAQGLFLAQTQMPMQSKWRCNTAFYLFTGRIPVKDVKLLLTSLTKAQVRRLCRRSLPSYWQSDPTMVYSSGGIIHHWMNSICYAWYSQQIHAIRQEVYAFFMILFFDLIISP